MFSFFEKNKLLFSFFLLLTISLGGFLRFYNLNWDEGQMFHPDERNIANAVARIIFFNNLNPDFFAYNGFSIYLYKTIGYVLSLWETKIGPSHFLAAVSQQRDLSFLEIDSAWTKDWSKINLIGRFISALSATASIFLVFLIGKKLLGETGALFSALIFAFTPTLIQYAHYGVTESLLVFFLLLITFLSIKTIEERKIIYWIYSGIIGGLAIASKISALSFLIIPFCTWCILLWQERKFLKYLARGIIFLFFCLLLFLMFSPYTILAFEKFKESMNYEGGIVTGKLKVPYNWQFFNTPAYIFQWLNLHWQTNIFVPTLGFLGIFLWLIFIVFRKENIIALPFLLFALGYFGYVGAWYTKFIRYLLPLVPFLIIASVWLVLKFFENSKTKILATPLLIGMTLFTVLWGLAFFSIYLRPHTRIVASKWIYKNVSPNSVLLTEHWDDRLPAPLLDENPNQYIYLEMKNYDADTPEKISEMAANLAKGNFIILSSRRLLGSIGKNPQEWPITSQYYQKLFEGKLGYKLATKITSYPQLFGFEINDDLAEETFQVYDHPTIWIFKNTEKFSEERIREILINYF